MCRPFVSAWAIWIIMSPDSSVPATVNNYVSISNKTNPRWLQFFTIFGIFRKIYNIPIGLNIVPPKVGHFFQLAKFPSHILLIFEYIREISHTPIVFPCAKHTVPITRQLPAFSSCANSNSTLTKQTTESILCAEGCLSRTRSVRIKG